MGGREPPIHPAHVHAPGRFFAFADANAMDGRIKSGHDVES